VDKVVTRLIEQGAVQNCVRAHLLENTHSYGGDKLKPEILRMISADIRDTLASRIKLSFMEEIK
jgi:hypothetical protein